MTVELRDISDELVNATFAQEDRGDGRIVQMIDRFPRLISVIIGVLEEAARAAGVSLQPDQSLKIGTVTTLFVVRLLAVQLEVDQLEGATQ